MKLVLVKLELLDPGTDIVSDVFDPLGKLLVKAPITLDENMKKVLLLRGVREVIIQDRRGISRVEDERAIKLKLEVLERRLSLLSTDPIGQEFKELIQQVVVQFYEQKK